LIRPNFFIVGAPRCGTTAMWHYLKQHPEVYLPPDKEPHFFGSDLRFQRSMVGGQAPLKGEHFLTSPPWPYPRTEGDTAQYLSRFSEAREVKRVGEASTWYLRSRRAATEIKEFDPSASIIIMLGNPVEMLASLHTLFVFLGIETIRDLGEVLRACEPRRSRASLPRDCTIVSNFTYRDSVRYADQVKRYIDTFGIDNVLVILHDDLKRDVSAAYLETLRFLNVEQDYRPDFRIVDPSTRARVNAVRSLA